MEKILSKPIFVFIVVLLITIPTLLPLFKQGFFPTQDYIYVARIFQMDKSLKSGQFPVRWVPDFRYGEPLYNFYAPLSYYAGFLIKTLGFTYLVTTKILFGLGLLLSGISMFYLGKEMFGKLGGLLSATLYIYAPYHSVDIYVRGALAESWALIFFPLIFLFAYKLAASQTRKNLIFLSLSLAGLFYTHSIMTVLFLPFFIAWAVFLYLGKRKIILGKYLILGIILGFGLAASFLFPAFFEKSFVQSKYLLQGYFDFRGHFVTIPEFFSTFWGYGASLWGPKDDMSFQVGLVHWGVFALSVFSAILLRKDRRMLSLSIFLAISFLFSLFMQHNKSAPIWEMFSPVLAYTQFPWRFLGISIFFVSILGGSLAGILKNKLSVVILLLVLVAIVGNVGFFHPESYYLDSIDAHYISPEILAKDDRLPKDYLPIWVQEIDANKITIPIAKRGKIEVSNFEKGSNWAKFSATVLDASGELEVPITYFPGWQVYSDNKKVNSKPSKLGLILFDIPNGAHIISLQFKNTQVRTVSNIVSLVSIVAIFLISRKKNFKI